METSWNEIKDFILFVSIVINGIVGYVKIREWFNNKPKIYAITKFEWNILNNLAVKIELYCTGNQPITIKKVICFIMPTKFWHRIFKTYYHRKNFYLFPIDISKRLDPGHPSFDIPLQIPNQLNWTDIYKIKALDSTDTFWEVKWPRKSTIKKRTSKLKLDNFSMKSKEREIQVSSYLQGGSYIIVINFIRDDQNIQYNTQMTKKFDSESNYKQHLIKLKNDIIPKFISLKLERID